MCQFGPSAFVLRSFSRAFQTRLGGVGLALGCRLRQASLPWGGGKDVAEVTGVRVAEGRGRVERAGSWFHNEGGP